MLIWYSPQAPNKLATLPSLRKVKISRGNYNIKRKCVASFLRASYDGRAKTYSFEASVQSTFVSWPFWGSTCNAPEIHSNIILLCRFYSKWRTLRLEHLKLCMKIESSLNWNKPAQKHRKMSQCVPVIIIEGNLLIYDSWRPSHLCPKSP